MKNERTKYVVRANSSWGGDIEIAVEADDEDAALARMKRDKVEGQP